MGGARGGWERAPPPRKILPRAAAAPTDLGPAGPHGGFGMSRRCGALLVALLVALGSTEARADGRGPGTRAVKGTVTVDEKGDAIAHHEVRFPAAEYAAVRASTPDPTPFLRRLRPSRPDYVLGTDAKGGYAEQEPVLALDWTAAGIARHRGDGRWELLLDETHLSGTPGAANGERPSMTFQVGGTLDRFAAYAGAVTWVLPTGATDVRWDGERRRLTWRRAVAGGEGAGRLEAEFEAKPRIMASAYKIYANGAGLAAQRVGTGGRFLAGADLAPPWVARVVLRNTGPGVLRDTKVRYKLEDYTADWSPWERFPDLAPGATAVSVYFPVIRSSIARLRDDTKAILYAQWSSLDATGKEKVTDEDTKITLLGVNEFVFNDLEAGERFDEFFAQSVNNGPLLASWVSRNDPVVKQFAALANKNAGGAFAPQDDATALKVIAQCYELLRINNFTYQAPPGLVSVATSFDVKSMQNVKFPRDVIKDKSGTCIDLAILFASMVNAVGLRPYLLVVPQHCFPAVALPSGRLCGVESTLVGGGVRFGSGPFKAALRTGMKEFEDALSSGKYILLPIPDLWASGISNPELEELPPDILQRWGITEIGPAGAQTDPFAGTWTGNLTQELEGGGTVTYPMAVTIEASADPLDDTDYLATSRAAAKIPSGQGTLQVDVVQNFMGAVDGGVLRLTGVSKQITMGAGAQPTEAEADTIVARIVDGRLEGKIGSDKEGWTPLSFRRD